MRVGTEAGAGEGRRWLPVTTPVGLGCSTQRRLGRGPGEWETETETRPSRSLPPGGVAVAASRARRRLALLERRRSGRAGGWGPVRGDWKGFLSQEGLCDSLSRPASESDADAVAAAASGSVNSHSFLPLSGGQRLRTVGRCSACLLLRRLGFRIGRGDGRRCHEGAHSLWEQPPTLLLYGPCPRKRRHELGFVDLG